MGGGGVRRGSLQALAGAPPTSALTASALSSPDSPCFTPPRVSVRTKTGRRRGWEGGGSLRDYLRGWGAEVEGRGGGSSRRFRIPPGDRTRADLFNRLQGGPTPVRPLNCSASTSFQKMKNKVRSYLRVVPRSHARGRAGGRGRAQARRERGKKKKTISLLFPLKLSSLLHPFLYPWQVIISPINPASFIPAL